VEREVPVSGNPGRTALAIAVAALMLAFIPSIATASPEGRMLAGINHARASHGLAALRRSGNLSASARRYSNYMLARDYFGHMSRIRASWSRWSWVGENLAMYPGWGTRVGSIVRGWLHSPAHRHVMLNPRFRAAGIGYVHGRMGRRRTTTVTLHVGRAR
jgi:uncharacterized protein YkwD